VLRYLARRLLLALLATIAVSIVTFALLRLAGDPAVAMAGPDASAADVERIRHAFGLDRPLAMQYLSWAFGVLRGDFGYSEALMAPVGAVVAARLPVTLTLGVAAVVVALGIALPLGIVAALHRNRWPDRIALAVAVAGQAMPSFFLALVLIAFLGMRWGWLPVSGNASWRNYVMPAFVLGLYAAPALLRVTRTGMLEVLGADYIRTAHAKGLSPARVALRHALPNAIIPVVALAAVQLGFLFSGSIVIESIFALNGVGYLAWQSVQKADVPTMQAIILVLAGLYIVATLAADLLNAVLDPRLRLR
jgi:ABC-type dipeptide/oligopeptide/nickel transport system permease component